MIPLSYSYRSLFVRWITTLLTAMGFTLVVAALVVMLAFLKGIEVVCAVSGEPENVVVLEEGKGDEVLSRLGRTLVSQVEAAPGILRDSQGRPLSSRELYMSVSILDPVVNDFVFLQIRGVTPNAFAVHRGVRIQSGRGFRPNQSEAIVGVGVQRARGLSLGNKIRLGRKEWTVTGVFEAGGSTFESEVWCDLDELASQFKREGACSSVVLRTPSAEAAAAAARRIDESKQYSASAKTEPEYYAEQARQTQFLKGAVFVIAGFMGMGAVFGVMNTMFAAISQRVKDIAVLRLLGFFPRDILASFLIEAVFVSALGGALGMALGFGVNGLSSNASVGSHAVEIAFRVDGTILAAAAAFSLVMGVLGGILPAVSAMRVRPLEAFR